MSFFYYASFIPGLQEIAADVIRERLSDVKIHKLIDGAVIFETDISYDKLNFFCFNNIFALINIINNSDDSLENHVRKIIKFTPQRAAGNLPNDTLCNSVLNTIPIINNNKKIKTFRIVISNENKPAAINDKLRAEIEKIISILSGLSVNRTLPDTEFWFLYRSEGFSVFMKRLTLSKTLHKGELPLQLTWVLCRLANLKASDTVLDPFCGYGSIPDAAIKYFHITKFITCDNDNKAVKYTKERLKKYKDTQFIFSDFFKLPTIINKTVDIIVTDPPWGHFKEHGDNQFLQKMFEVFNKLLISGGRVVILYAKDDEFLNNVPPSFKLQNSVPLLLSGKKAVIYCFIKS